MGSNLPDPKKTQRTKKSSELLDKVIDAMLRQLDRPMCKECGFAGVNASDITNITRFLKDNGFSVDKEDNEDFLSRLSRERKEREAAGQGVLDDVEDNVQSRTA